MFGSMPISFKRFVSRFLGWSGFLLVFGIPVVILILCASSRLLVVSITCCSDMLVLKIMALVIG